MTPEQQEKLEKLCDQEGCNPEDMKREYANANVVPGICMNDGCDFTTGVDRHEMQGTCEDCFTDTVMSVIELMEQ